MTLSDVADRIDGYDTGGLSRFERGEQGVGEDKLYQIASLLGVSVTTLYAVAEYGENIDYAELENFLANSRMQAGTATTQLCEIPCKSVPLISWVQAGEWTEVGHVYDHKDDAQEWIATVANVSPNAFALRVEGDSMTNPYGAPSIPEGAIVVVEPNREPSPGNIVVALLEESNNATLKRLVFDGPKKYLKPLNPAYQAIEINGNCRIVGVALRVEVEL